MGFRKITNKGGVRKFIGKFPSYVHKKIIRSEGRLERDFLYLIEWDYLDVLGIAEQACRIYYMHEGKRRRFTVDFLVKRKHKNQIVEIKHSGQARKLKYQVAFRAARALAKREGYEFKMYTEVTIRRQPRLNNIIYYQRTEVYPQHQVLCHEFFANRDEASLQELMEFFEAKGVEKSVVYALLRWGVISFDIDAPLIPEARVYLPSSDVGNMKVA